MLFTPKCRRLDGPIAIELAAIDISMEPQVEHFPKVVERVSEVYVSFVLQYAEKTLLFGMQVVKM